MHSAWIKCHDKQTVQMQITAFCYPWLNISYVHLIKPDEKLRGGKILRRVLGRLHPHVLNVLGMQMKSRLHMQSSHVPHTTWLIN